jgi:hypothetical protein
MLSLLTEPRVCILYYIRREEPPVTGAMNSIPALQGLSHFTGPGLRLVSEANDPKKRTFPLKGCTKPVLRHQPGMQE